MKKLLLILLCFILAFSLMACGGKEEPATNPSESQSGQESTDATVEGDATAGGEDATTQGENNDATTGEGDDTTKDEDADGTTEGKDTSATEGNTTTGKVEGNATTGKIEGNPSATPTGKVEGNATTGKTEATKPGTTGKTQASATIKPGTTKKTDTVISDNVVIWEEVFGTDPTTTSSTKPGETTTTTTTTTTASTTTTTVAPTVVEKVILPAVGTDVDVVKQKGRLRISAIDLKDGKLSVNIKYESTGWITEETDYVKYACYDKNGKELKGTDDFFGYFYLGCLEVGDEETFNVNLPAGTVEVKLVDSKIVYWTEWS